MLTPSETTSYERNSNTAAGLCANCHVKLHPFETHVCDNCAGNLLNDKEMTEGGGDEAAEGSKL